LREFQPIIRQIESLEITGATTMDAGPIGEILSQAVDLADWHPRVHSRAEEIHYCSRMIELGWIRVARKNGQAVGFIARDHQDIVALYINSNVQRRGIAMRLLKDAKNTETRLTAWCYDKNIAAQKLYIHQQFREVCRTDGLKNDVGLPDIKYVWTYKN
jgi:GNAT superfamily N-acetyltransferase